MANRNVTRRDPGREAAQVAGAIGDWIEESGDLIDALVLLRKAGREEAAIDALLAVREVQYLRASWELWAMVMLGYGHDSKPLLTVLLGDALYDRLRFALWGEQAPLQRLTVVR